MAKQTWGENNARQKMWQKAIKTALADYNNPVKKIKAGEALFKIGHELVDAAIDRTDPNWQFAVKELGLRLDGKPTEHHEIGNPDEIAGNLIGISAVYAAFERLTQGDKTPDRTLIMQDGSLLPPPVRPKKRRHGEIMDIRPLSDDPGQS